MLLPTPTPLPRPIRDRHAARVSGTLHMLLGGVLALLMALVCSLVASPERAALPALRALTSQRLASMPLPPTGQSDCALESETVDVDDDTDEESKLGHDDTPPVDVPHTYAFGDAAASCAHCIHRSTPVFDTSRFAASTHLARGPPVRGEAFVL